MTTHCVPFKFTIDGQEFEAYIAEKNFELLSKFLNKKKTKYERAEYNEKYFYENSGIVDSSADWGKEVDNMLYKSGNYYLDKTVAENNVRADNLMRQLRRFAVENRSNNKVSEKYYIYYLRDSNLLQLKRDTMNRFIGPWFDSQHAGAQAIEVFHDELIWYFTEYKDSL